MSAIAAVSLCIGAKKKAHGEIILKNCVGCGRALETIASHCRVYDWSARWLLIREELKISLLIVEGFCMK